MNTKNILPVSSEEDAWWRMPGRWLAANTFTPPWLPAGRYTGLTGVLVAGVLQGLVILLLARHFPASSFIDTPALLVVLLISFGWGAAAGLLATVIGALLFVFIMMPSSLTSGFHIVEQGMGLLLYLLLGLSLTVMACQSRRALLRDTVRHRDAGTVRGYLHNLLLHSPIPVSVVQGPEHRLTEFPV